MSSDFFIFRQGGPPGAPPGGCPADGQLIPVVLFNNGVRALPPEAEIFFALEHPFPKAGGRPRMLRMMRMTMVIVMVTISMMMLLLLMMVVMVAPVAATRGRWTTGT